MKIFFWDKIEIIFIKITSKVKYNLIKSILNLVVFSKSKDMWNYKKNLEASDKEKYTIIAKKSKLSAK